MARLMVPNGGSLNCCRRRSTSGRERTRRAISSRNFSSTQREMRLPRALVVHFDFSGQVKHLLVVYQRISRFCSKLS